MPIKSKPDKIFIAALKSLPPPIPMGGDCAFCPWCGEAHEQITIGANNCEVCARYFLFGYPENWESLIENMPETWAPFSHHAFENLPKRASLYPAFKPNARLIEIYKMFNEAYGLWPKIKQVDGSNVIQFKPKAKPN